MNLSRRRFERLRWVEFLHSVRFGHLFGFIEMRVTANNFFYFSLNVLSALLEMLNQTFIIVISIDRNLFRDAPWKHWQTTVLLHFAVSFPHLNHFELIELIDRASDCMKCVGHFEICQAQSVSRLRSNCLKRSGGLLYVSTG